MTAVAVAAVTPSNSDWPNTSDPQSTTEHPDAVKEDEQLYGAVTDPSNPQVSQNHLDESQIVSAPNVSISDPNSSSTPTANQTLNAHLFHQYQASAGANSVTGNGSDIQQAANLGSNSGNPTGPSATGSKIFVGGLSWETDEDSLRRYFEQIGKVIDCVIMRDRNTGHPRGFGFVTFADEEAANQAASRRHDLDGRQVEAKHAVPRNEGSGGTGTPSSGSGFGAGNRGAQQRFGTEIAPQGAQAGAQRHHTTRCKVFVGGLPSGCGNDEFKGYFSQYGEVADAQVMIDHNTGNSRGFGFVTFGNEATVSAVVGPGKSNTNHEIMGKCVEVKRAEPKGAPNDRRNHRDNYGADRGGIRNATPNNDMNANNPQNENMNDAAAAAAAAYYSHFPSSLAEQYGAYYNNPQWQQYYAAMGYNFSAYPQGYSPYQQYLQAYMNNAASAANGTNSPGARTNNNSADGQPNASVGVGGKFTSTFSTY